MNLIGCNSNQLREILLYLKYDSILMGNDQLLFVLKHESKIKTKKIKSNAKKKHNTGTHIVYKKLIRYGILNFNL